jgi:hypothetical protein
VGDLVDARLPRSQRMPLADRQQYKRRLRGLAVDAEHRAPATIGLRNVVLHTSAEPGTVTRFNLARAQGADGDAVHLQVADRRLNSRLRRRARAPKILGERLLVNAKFKTETSRPVADRLPLAVGGLHQRPMLAPELLGLLRRHRPGPGPLANLLDRSCLGRPIRRVDEPRLRRFLLGHRPDLLDQLSLGHK